MRNCGNCRHWEEYGSSKYGACGRLKHHAERHGELDNGRTDGPDDAAVLIDGSDYFAALRCRSDFGCVLHEPLESKCATPDTSA